ncbi:MAG: cellulase family glycosylhydrolase [Chitinispirillia bacterium]|jgi:aryl-phospho-beta-D-glucosidase BglC (GH1 family)
MKSKGNKLFLFAVILTLLISTVTYSANVWSVDSKGNITLNGQVFRVKGGSWFGLEGRHELATDPVNPSGAPMEMYMGNVFWAPSSRTLAGDAKEFKSLGFNSIRIPVAPQTLNDNDPQGRDPNLKNAESVRIQGAFTALKATVKACADAGLYVLLDIHSCSNYVGWRAGRLDARPPYVDNIREKYEFKREDYSCDYNESKWLTDLKTLAGLGKEIGVDNIMGIDIFNEPWDYSWEEWAAMIDKAYAAINSVNPNILIYAQGIGGTHGNQDGSPDTKTVSPHGEIELNPNWGENLFEAGKKPPKMPKNKLVYSPHTYGPSVHVQKMFMDPSQPECKGLEAEEAGDKKCNIVINPEILEKGWDEHFGYLKKMGYAMAIGEFGGNMEWPNKSEARHQDRWGFLADKTVDKQWQEAFVNYLIKRGIHDSFYWSINPESADTYGIFKTPYDPLSNKAGWGTWTGVDNTKLNMLKKLWNAPTPITKGAVNSFASSSLFLKLYRTNTGFTVSTQQNGIYKIEIIDIKGKTLISKSLKGKGSIIFNQTDLGNGILLLKISDALKTRIVPLMNIL